MKGRAHSTSPCSARNCHECRAGRCNRRSSPRCANAAIMDIAGEPPRVFDAVPRGTAFPYIVIGDDKETDWSTATEQGSEHLLAVHVWSRSPGLKELARPPTP